MYCYVPNTIHWGMLSNLVSMKRSKQWDSEMYPNIWFCRESISLRHVLTRRAGTEPVETGISPFGHMIPTGRIGPVHYFLTGSSSAYSIRTFPFLSWHNENRRKRKNPIHMSVLLVYIYTDILLLVTNETIYHIGVPEELPETPKLLSCRLQFCLNHVFWLSYIYLAEKNVFP